jgi:nitrous oxidase accessory protein
MRGTVLKIVFTGLLVLLAQTGMAQIVVSPEGEINSIKQAVEMAEPGAHIQVQPGTYLESNIGIDKKITLEGIDYPLIDGNS